MGKATVDVEDVGHEEVKRGGVWPWACGTWTEESWK